VDDQTGDDSFELAPRRVGNARRPWVAVLGVAAAALAIVLVAALSGGSADPGGDVAGRPSSGDIAATSPSPSPSGAAAAVTAPRPVPDSLTCHHVDRSACHLAVATALGTLGGDVPDVAAADVWSGLVCGDTLDCPPNRLDGRSTPLANVVLHIDGGGPAAWINVVYRSHGRPLDFDPTVEAWIARWQVLP
jgi:hypothetical protein